ncbi:hypothetical protein [Endozoicomonas sp. SCSIO W0465]|uniref:hypothetical protein n=1 Tax=Endozoicomonas sp. SCSIO W0465 TaxID=2918516 RepID=UPI002074E03D|nr:hypothetical protein [Endozoicomonas sp. SCSIO W0465]USE37930.1 hypothetical protein MJO57_07000 [Endozoicomonas sp. SCSIO W0465]
MDHPTYQQYLVTGKARLDSSKDTIMLVDPNTPIQNRSTVLLAVEGHLMIGEYRHDNGQYIFRPEGEPNTDIQLPDLASIRGRVVGRFEPEE